LLENRKNGFPRVNLGDWGSQYVQAMRKMSLPGQLKPGRLKTARGDGKFEIKSTNLAISGRRGGQILRFASDFRRKALFEYNGVVVFADWSGIIA